MTLARDSLSSGNTVTAENYFQHAEHYNRIIQAAQAKQEEQAAAHSAGAGGSASGPGKTGGRNNDRRPRQPNDRDDASVKPADAASVPGTGEQPPLNANGAPDDQGEKPKRKPRPRRPKAVKTEADDGPKSKDEPSNITA